MRRRLALLALPVLALTGCGADPVDPPPTPTQFAADAIGDEPPPGNGLWLLRDDDAADEIIAAVSTAGTVTYRGDFTELTAGEAGAEPRSGRSLHIEFTGSPQRYTAAITAGTLGFEAVTVDGRSYVRGNADFAASTGIPEVEHGFVCTAGAALLEEWATFLRPRDLIAELLDASGSISVRLPSGDTETLDVIVGTTDAPAGTATVRRTGPPLPLDFTAGDPTGTGAFAFSAWGEPVTVTAPANPVISCD